MNERFYEQGYNFIVKEKPQIVCIDVVLTVPIIPDILDNAINKVIRKHKSLYLTYDINEKIIFKKGNKYYKSHKKDEYDLTNNKFFNRMFDFIYDSNCIEFRWNHFIMDGKGAILILNNIIKNYIKYYNKAHLNNNFNQNDKISLLTNGSNNYIIELNKEMVINDAIANNVKPFSYLMALMSKMIFNVLGKEQSSFVYPIDTRRFQGNKHRIQNSCIVFKKEFNRNSHNNIKDFISFVDFSIKDDLKTNNIIDRRKESVDCYKYINNLQTNLKIKRRITDKTEEIYDSDVVFSYNGNPFSKSDKYLENYILNYVLFKETTHKSTKAIIEEISLKDKMILGVCDKTEKQSFKKLLIECFDKYIIKS